MVKWFLPEKVRIANKYMKWCSVSLEKCKLKISGIEFNNYQISNIYKAQGYKEYTQIILG